MIVLMKRTSIVLLLACLQGCATYYPVRMNGYLNEDAASAIKPESSFSVQENQGAENPIFDREIRKKIENSLAKRGYRFDSADRADFTVNYSYGISQGKTVTDLRPEYRFGGTGTITTHSADGAATSYITYPGYTTYVPYRYVLHTSWLTLRVFERTTSPSTPSQPLWIGESSMTAQNADLRESIDYLLVGAFANFGKDTRRSVTVRISPNDPQLEDLSH